MTEHHKVDNLKIENRRPDGGEIKAMRCKKCDAIVVSNRPGDPFTCKCGWTLSRTK